MHIICEDDVPIVCKQAVPSQISQQGCVVVLQNRVGININIRELNISDGGRQDPTGDLDI